MKIQATTLKATPSLGTTEAVPAPEQVGAVVPKEAQAQTQPQQQQQKPELGRAEVDKAVEKLNETARVLNHNTLQFQVADSTNRIIIKVIDSESKEVIREIPPEGVLEALRRIDDALGVLLDKRV